jgi:hypothetical protein
LSEDSNFVPEVLPKQIAERRLDDLALPHFRADEAAERPKGAVRCAAVL